jgi:hypothetical protein
MMYVYIYIYVCVYTSKFMYNIIYIYIYIHVFSLVGSFLARTCTGFDVQMECLGMKVKIRLAEICRI